MFKVHMAHLTGTATILENGLWVDKIEFDTDPAFSPSQMFFKPYESGKEFIFCARHTLFPLLLTTIFAMQPIQLIAFPAIMLCSSLVYYGLGLITRGATSTWFLKMADEICNSLCQNIVDLILMPLTAITMITRGISTGLKATGLHDYDALENQARNGF